MGVHNKSDTDIDLMAGCPRRFPPASQWAAGAHKSASLLPAGICPPAAGGSAFHFSLPDFVTYSLVFLILTLHLHPPSKLLSASHTSLLFPIAILYCRYILLYPDLVFLILPLRQYWARVAWPTLKLTASGFALQNSPTIAHFSLVGLFQFLDLIYLL